MPKEKRKLNTNAVLRTYWQFTKLHPWLLSSTVAGAVISQLSLVILPVYVARLFNLLVTNPESNEIFFLLAMYAAISMVEWAGTRMEMWLGYRLISRVGVDLTNHAFNSLMRHSYHFFTSTFAGALTRRVGRFSTAYENLQYAAVTVMLQGSVYVLGVTIVLATRNWILGGVVAFWVVVFVTLQWLMSRWQQPLRLKRAEEDSNLTATLADSISNQNTVALFSGNVYENTVVGGAAEAFRRAQQKSWDFNTIVFGVQGLLSITLNVGMLTLGVLLWRQGVLTIGDLVLIQIYVFGIFESVWNLGRQFHTMYTSLADASEMVEILERPHEVKDKQGAKKLHIAKGEVDFDRITFSYSALGGERVVLRDFSLHIAGGEKVALVGPSGAGKTTVTKLLLRLYNLQSGRIEIDGQDISAVEQESLREHIAFVPQEPVLFHRTLMENIRYGRRDAADEEVLAAAKQAHCSEFIEQLPQGYDTFVGERGVKLSGGERQRVAIARAILKSAPILVLDEATSSLDSQSEALIQDALEVLMRDKTVIVIAHRLSTVMKMDRIIVMDGGGIVAQGTHLELTRGKGLYQKLWSIQAGGFIGQPDEERPQRTGAPLPDFTNEGEEAIDAELAPPHEER